MRVCNSRLHDEIVHMDGYCPLCEALATIAQLEEKINDLESERDNHERKNE